MRFNIILLKAEMKSNMMLYYLDQMSQNLILAFAFNITLLENESCGWWLKILAQISKGSFCLSFCSVLLASSVFSNNNNDITSTVKVFPEFVHLLTPGRQCRISCVYQGSL